jgi:hypothetical protein
MRWILVLAGLAAATACAGPPYEPRPQGMVYQCGGEQASIVYDRRGYLPGLTVPEKGQLRPRSTATLTWQGRETALMGDWTVEEGLRYRSEQPYDFDNVLVWEAQGENAYLSLLPVRDDREPRLLARCERIRDAAALGAGYGSGASKGKAETSHRR